MSADHQQIFLSYKSEFSRTAALLYHCLVRRCAARVYYYPERREAEPFPAQIKAAIEESTAFVILVSENTETSDWQREEARLWRAKVPGLTKTVVVMVDGSREPSWLVGTWRDIVLEQVGVPTSDPNWAVRLTDRILPLLQIQPMSFDDLPIKPTARYEKDIIELYVRREDPELASRVAEGYPDRWPDVVRIDLDGDDGRDNPLDEKLFGKQRKDGAAVRVDARLDTGGGVAPALTFPEAGPRQRIIDRPQLNAAVLVSGGIAPGINAVLAGIVERHEQYKLATNHELNIWGYPEGFRGLRRRAGTNRSQVELKLEGVLPHVNRGGSLLPTARADDFLAENPETRADYLDKVVNRLRTDEVDILYVLGGEGSMRAAHAIWTAYHQHRNRKNPLSVIGVPKTMDNDILWVWQSFGFLSAVEKARENIIQLYTEVTSNPRVGVVQLFGSGSGYVVSHAALGSNVCDVALIPEIEFTMRDVCEYMSARLSERLNKGAPAGLVVMAETAIPADYEVYQDEEYVGLTSEEKKALKTFAGKGKRVLGQTPDALRSSGLKIVSRVLEQHIRTELARRTRIEYWKDYRVLTNEPRHIIRSMEPSVTDVALGIRLGTMAVDMAMAGYSDCMVSQWLTEYVVVPLKLVVLGRKEVPPEGIFWKTVASKTGQMRHPGLAGPAR